MNADEAFDSIARTFHSAEGMAYLGEAVTMIEHQLQAAAQARAAGQHDALIVAALLHDVGHLVEEVADDRDAHHDATGARWLSQWFGPDVTEPVRLHVAAKRYLVATEPGYAARLSDASTHTLRLQGGPMLPREVHEFDGLDHSQDAIALRRLDETAKDASRVAPRFDTYRSVVRRVLTHS